MNSWEHSIVWEVYCRMELWFVALLGFLLLVLGLVVGMVLGNRLAWKCVEDIDLAGRNFASSLEMAVQRLRALVPDSADGGE